MYSIISIDLNRRIREIQTSIHEVNKRLPPVVWVNTSTISRHGVHRRM